MKNCSKDWSQSKQSGVSSIGMTPHTKSDENIGHRTYGVGPTTGRPPMCHKLKPFHSDFISNYDKLV